MLDRSVAKAIQAILFDKDGTLIDFQRTWGPAVHEVMLQLADGSQTVYKRLAAISTFVEAEMSLQQDSLLVAHPTPVWGALWARELGCAADTSFLTDLDRRLCKATTVHLIPIGDPGTLVKNLARHGYRVGVFSNDAEKTVRAHMSKLGIDKALHFIAGYDSGFGSKPSAGPVLAFARAVRVSPSRVAVVGDTTLDLAAARAAGAVAIGVLTGPAPVETLAPVADVVLPSADDVATWIAGT